MSEKDENTTVQKIELTDATPAPSEEHKPSVFDVLSQVDCSGHVEHIERKSKKTGKVTARLSYLSWVWAWAILNHYYPGSQYKIYKDEHGWIYHTDGRTAWVEVGVTVEGLEYIECLPVMDYNNNPIPLAQVNSFNANTAIQRALTKAIARHGLGLSIYAGEDVPPKKGDDTTGAEPPAPKVYQKSEKKENQNYIRLKDPEPPKEPEDPHYWRKQCVKAWRAKGYSRDALLEVFHFTKETTEQEYQQAFPKIQNDEY